MSGRVEDVSFLEWLRDRLVMVYGESPNVDFVQKLERITERVKALPSESS